MDNGSGQAEPVAQRPPLFNAQVLPTGYAVHQADNPQLGEVALIELGWPEGSMTVVLPAENAEDIGEKLIQAGRRAKAGIVAATPSDVERIAERRAKTEAMRGRK